MRSCQSWVSAMTQRREQPFCVAFLVEAGSFPLSENLLATLRSDPSSIGRLVGLSWSRFYAEATCRPIAARHQVAGDQPPCERSVQNTQHKPFFWYYYDAV